MRTALAVVAAIAAASSPTVVRQVSPVDTTGVLKPAYEIKHHYGGARCQSGSAMTGTAYRCFTSRAPQGVFDPCWVTDTSDQVICLTQPWRKKNAVELRVIDGYDDTDGFPHQSWPWGLRVDLPRRCLLHPAAVEYAHGHAIHYYCNKHTALAGPLDRSGSRWRIRAYRNTTPHAVQPSYKRIGWVHVITAWRGGRSRTG
jgi:hypothetical protein